MNKEISNEYLALTDEEKYQYIINNLKIKEKNRKFKYDFYELYRYTKLITDDKYKLEILRKIFIKRNRISNQYKIALNEIYHSLSEENKRQISSEMDDTTKSYLVSKKDNICCLPNTDEYNKIVNQDKNININMINQYIENPEKINSIIAYENEFCEPNKSLIKELIRIYVNNHSDKEQKIISITDMFKVQIFSINILIKLYDNEVKFNGLFNWLVNNDIIYGMFPNDTVKTYLIRHVFAKYQASTNIPDFIKEFLIRMMRQNNIIMEIYNYIISIPLMSLGKEVYEEFLQIYFDNSFVFKNDKDNPNIYVNNDYGNNTIYNFNPENNEEFIEYLNEINRELHSNKKTVA